MLDPNELLSDIDIRGTSKIHKNHPYAAVVDGLPCRIDYEPAESTTGLFGGNSNWRGPVWFPVNYLLVEALERYHNYYGDSLKVETPAGSGKMLTLREAALELQRRLGAIFLADSSGRRP